MCVYVCVYVCACMYVYMCMCVRCVYSEETSHSKSPPFPIVQQRHRTETQSLFIPRTSFFDLSTPQLVVNLAMMCVTILSVMPGQTSSANRMLRSSSSMANRCSECSLCCCFNSVKTGEMTVVRLADLLS